MSVIAQLEYNEKFGSSPTKMKLDSNSQKYVTVINRLKDELIIRQESESILLEDIHDLQDSNFELNRELHRCQRSNLNIVDELQACQTANAILRDELFNLEKQERKQKRRGDKYRNACKILKSEIMHKEKMQNESKYLFETIKDLSLKALEGCNENNELCNVLQNIADLADKHTQTIETELITYERSYSCSSDSTSSVTCEDEGISTSTGIERKEQSLIKSKNVTSDYDSNDDYKSSSNESLNNTTSKSIDSSTYQRPITRDSYVIIEEGEENNQWQKKGSFVIPEIIIDSSACNDNMSNGTSTSSPIRLADSNPTLFNQKIIKILRDTSPIHSEASYKGRKYLCPCPQKECIHQIHGEYEFITEEV